MLSRLDAPHELGEKIQSTNLTTERHQALEALRVVATNDRQVPSSHKTSKCRHRDNRISEKIRSCKVTTRTEEHQRRAIEKGIPRSTASQRKRAQHKAPAIVLAINPGGPQFRRQRRERRFIASTITSDLRIVPSNKEAHRAERQRERDRETQLSRQPRRARYLSYASTPSHSCAREGPGARGRAVP